MEPEWGPAAMVDLPREDVQIGMGAAVAKASGRDGLKGCAHEP